MPKLFFKYLMEKLRIVDEIYLTEFASLINENIRLIGWVCGWIAWAIIGYQILNPIPLQASPELVLFYCVGIWFYPLITVSGYLVWRDYRDWLDELTESEREEIENE